MGFSTMAFTAKILSWHFRHLNIVGCLLKRRPTKGGGTGTPAPSPPSYAPEEAMDICLWVLKESKKSRFDSYGVRNSVLIICHITYWDCCIHTCSNDLSQTNLAKTERILARWLVESYGLWEYRPWKWRDMSRSAGCFVFGFS